ncbi:MAG: DnaB-like helicase C-terminal domain-containing protein [Bacteroidota bacterium]|nr:DnaB-like helicase C-terminal domain-containing protein [Bacteroidota bacterium]
MITQIDAEKFVVGFLLTSNVRGVQYLLTSGLNEDCFSDAKFRLLYEGCISLYVQRKEINILNVQTFLGEQDENHFRIAGKTKNEIIPLLSLLASEIVDEFPFLKMKMEIFSASTFLVKETQRLKVSFLLQKLHQQLMDGMDVTEMLNAGTSELLSLAHSINGIGQRNYVSLADAIKEAEEEIKSELSSKVNWLSTGLPEVDKMIHGLHNERLYIIGAEAKVGKSLLSNQIALFNAKQNISVGIISMEMSAREIVNRFAGISQWSNPEEKQRTLETFKQEAKGKPIYFRQGGTSTKSLFSILQNLVTEKRCKLIVLDYLQLIQLSEKSRNAVDEINTVLSELKSFAVENQIPIILVSALLTKQVANKSNKKPSRADIAGTGRAINDCDCMLMMWTPEEEDRKNIEIFVEHGRNGEHGKAGLLLTDTLKLVPTTLREATPLKEYKPKPNYGGNW